jgi:hypothetical protein
MKKAFYYLFIAVAILSVTGCKKTSLDTDNGCITRVTRDFSINAIDSAADVQLLQQNNIPTSNLVFISPKDNSVITNSTGTNIFTVFIALQKANGLLIFNSGVAFHFKNNLYSSTLGQTYNPVLNLGTTPKLSLPQVRKLFINAAANNNIYGHVNYTDSCLVAQFGYYDIDLGGGTGPNIVPAWMVTTSSRFPIVYIRDDNKTLIAFYFGEPSF